MNKPKSNRDEVRENNLSIPMTKKEKDAVRSASQKSGLTMTAWARMALKEAANRSE